MLERNNSRSKPNTPIVKANQTMASKLSVKNLLKTTNDNIFMDRIDSDSTYQNQISQDSISNQISELSFHKAALESSKKNLELSTQKSNRQDCFMFESTQNDQDISSAEYTKLLTEHKNLCKKYEDLNHKCTFLNDEIIKKDKIISSCKKLCSEFNSICDKLKFPSIKDRNRLSSKVSTLMNEISSKDSREIKHDHNDKMKDDNLRIQFLEGQIAKQLSQIDELKKRIWTLEKTDEYKNLMMSDLHYTKEDLQLQFEMYTNRIRELENQSGQTSKRNKIPVHHINIRSPLDDKKSLNH